MKYWGKYVLAIAVFITMGVNIDWNKESIKAFITGGVLTWMAMRH